MTEGCRRRRRSYYAHVSIHGNHVVHEEVTHRNVASTSGSAWFVECLRFSLNCSACRARLNDSGIGACKADQQSPQPCKR